MRDLEVKTYEVGKAVKAFHPKMVGVVKDGRIVGVGSKYIRIDFGINGVHRVTPKDIVSEAIDWRA